MRLLLGGQSPDAILNGSAWYRGGGVLYGREGLLALDRAWLAVATPKICTVERQEMLGNRSQEIVLKDEIQCIRDRRSAVWPGGKTTDEALKGKLVGLALSGAAPTPGPHHHERDAGAMYEE